MSLKSAPTTASASASASPTNQFVKGDKNTPGSIVSIDNGKSMLELFPEWFERRVGRKFYETEEELGPMPPQWSKAYKGKQIYFVNDTEKITSWVDPRTWNSREHDIFKVKQGELPYGWDEAVDAEIGVYYIDHNTQATYLDPPWDPYVQQQAAALKEHIKVHVQRVRELEARLTQPIAQRQKEAEAKVRELDLEVDLLNRQLADGGSAADDEELRAHLADTVERQRLEALLASGDIEETVDQVRQLKVRLAELKGLHEKLKANRNDAEDMKSAREEILFLRDQLINETTERMCLEEEILKFKSAFEGLGTPVVAAPVLTLPAPEPMPELPPVEPLAAPSGRRKTRYDMELEVLMLKKRLNKEKEESQKLGYLKRAAEIGPNGAGGIPDWLRQLQLVATNSTTVRVKIRQKQRVNPDMLSFRERMLYFTSGEIDAGGQASKPRPAAPAVSVASSLGSTSAARKKTLKRSMGRKSSTSSLLKELKEAE